MKYPFWDGYLATVVAVNFLRSLINILVLSEMLLIGGVQ